MLGGVAAALQDVFRLNSICIFLRDQFALDRFERKIVKALPETHVSADIIKRAANFYLPRVKVELQIIEEEDKRHYLHECADISNTLELAETVSKQPVIGPNKDPDDQLGRRCHSGMKS